MEIKVKKKTEKDIETDSREPCFECGRPSAHNHHVIPKIRGGTKTVPLCLSCHGKVHDKEFWNLSVKK